MLHSCTHAPSSATSPLAQNTVIKHDSVRCGVGARRVRSGCEEGMYAAGESAGCPMEGREGGAWEAGAPAASLIIRLSVRSVGGSCVSVTVCVCLCLCACLCACASVCVCKSVLADVVFVAAAPRGVGRTQEEGTSWQKPSASPRTAMTVHCAGPKYSCRLIPMDRNQRKSRRNSCHVCENTIFGKTRLGRINLIAKI